MATQRTLGKNGPSITPVGIGLMEIGAAYGTGSSQEEVDALLTRATDIKALKFGIRLMATETSYGSAHKKIGHWFAENPALRKDVFLCTKFGLYHFTPETIKPTIEPCSDPAYILQQLGNALEDLQTEYIDLYYQHAVDPKVPIEVVLETLRPAVESGQIRWLGLSNCSAETLRRAKAVPGLGDKIIAVEMEYNPFDLDVETNGIADACKELGVSLVAYCPLGRGLLSGKFHSRADFEPTDGRLHLPRFSEENFPKNIAIVDKIRSIAKSLSISVAQVTLSWILASHPEWFVIPGTRSPGRMEENEKAAGIALPAQVVADIRKVVEDADIAGKRIPDVYAHLTAGNCIPLSEWKK